MEILRIIKETALVEIITITFSPCIDKSTSVELFIPEKKLKCKNPKLEPGGGGVNVARAICKLGGKAIAVFPSGGYSGKFLNQLLDEENVPYNSIESKNETRENFTVFEESTSKQYRFGMPGIELFEREWKSCVDAIKGIANADFIVASGSLPPGVPANVYTELASIAKNKNARFIVDASGESLKLAINEGVYLCKPNLGELASLAGKDELGIDEIEHIAKGVIAKGGCEVFVVSMGAMGAFLVTESAAEIIKPPPVEAVSTVGAGDSMVAGIVHYLSIGRNLLESVKYGVACGSAATINPGTGLCRKEDADKLYRLL